MKMRVDHRRPEFGAAVTRELDKRGLTLRGQRIRTGIDPMTMRTMKAMPAFFGKGK